MNSLSTTDKDHLARIAQEMNWHLIARVMRILGWTWYFTAPDAPTAGQLRDEALGQLADCLREARCHPQGRSNLLTGGFEYSAHVCPVSGHIESLRCVFALEACDSAD